MREDKHNGINALSLKKMNEYINSPSFFALDTLQGLVKDRKFHLIRNSNIQPSGHKSGFFPVPQQPPAPPDTPLACAAPPNHLGIITGDSVSVSRQQTE